jgi:hypothetical protein
MALVMLLALPTAVTVAGMAWTALSGLVLNDTRNHVLPRPQRLRSYSV